MVSISDVDSITSETTEVSKTQPNHPYKTYIIILLILQNIISCIWIWFISHKPIPYPLQTQNISNINIHTTQHVNHGMNQHEQTS